MSVETAIVEAACDSSLADVLDWQENGYRVEQGLEVPSIIHRQLSRSLVSFLLDRALDQPFPKAVLAIGNMSRAELLALESDWRVWLRHHCPDTEGRGR